MTASPNANSTGNSNQPNRGANRSRGGNNQKKITFTGTVDNFGDDVLTMPSERPRGTGPNHAAFQSALRNYIGREVSKGNGRLWAKAYLLSEDSNWKPPFPTKPSAPDDPNDPQQQHTYDQETSIYKGQVKDYEEAIGAQWTAAKLTIFHVILGQCSPKLVGQLEQLEGFNDADRDHDSIWLLKQALLLSGGGTVLGFEPYARMQAIRDLFYYKQAKHQPLDEFMNEFKAKMQTIKTLNGEMQFQDIWHRADGEKVTTTQGVMVCLFLDSLYKPKYGECIRFLRNDAAKGTINFPATLAAAYKMVDEYVAMPQKQNQNPRNNNANSDDVESYIDIDPSQPEGEICLTNTKYEELVKLDPWWFLLDTASTITICNNPSFLKGIRKAKHPVVIHTSGGQLTATLEGFLPFLQRWVSFHPDCLGNILSFRDVLKAHHVTMNSRQSHTFVVHFLRRRKGKTIKKVHFRPSGTGLFYFDTQADIKETFQRFKVRNSSFSETSQSSLEDHEEHEVLNLTVKEKLKAFSPRQRNGIEKAREVYASVGRPGFDKFIRMIQYRQMPNLPINVQDAKNMMKAYGPDVHALKGKVVRRKPDHVATGRRFSIPPEIINANSDVVLCTDIFFVDGIPFLLAVSRNIRHVFVDVLESRAMVTQVLPLLKRWCNRKASP